MIVVGMRVLAGIPMSPASFEWFYGLRLPASMLPRVYFGIAWSIIYSLLAGAIANILMCYHPAEIPTLVGLFFAQVIAHVSWGFVFFGMHKIEYGFYNILALSLLVFFLVIETAKYSKFSALMLLPYLLWISFATYLSYAIMILNI